jgi:DNA-binding NarL/FixJ family response regulator
MPHRILIVDDNEIVRASIRTCIEKNTDWQVCGEAENGQLAIEGVRNLRPEVVILDWQMPVMNGLDAAREIARIAPETILLMLTLHDIGALRQQAIDAGVKEVLSKSDKVSEHLVASLRNVHANN